ncbi:related to cytochrome P450 CYP3/CYP5/CYP6/CYP9 subfamilies [Cephalotrichum gorgonifer]|uniref:Related to cytochrome P450 CYP3/CYP5/CYP6/CYP9 subfamilies n=1 Tax=Cephalotrichum gorgonifer TaxID=2041049 RepID=A0AAE8MVU0_9PEZI|nr:related to cytochrome P450 CYP3/CYP5/CYP6/CYP9 subfamilies [Cephalotrichum gorgonifer]
MADPFYETGWLIPLGLLVVVLPLPCYFLYNIFLHPLRSYAGPWYTKASLIWYLYHSFVGDYHIATLELHLKYGPVVRVAPNELAYTDPQAWKDIYGHRSGQPENVKDPSRALDDNPDHPSILFAGREEHSKVRRLLSNAFSDKAIREQEHIISSYVDLMIRGLHQICEEPVDMTKWYNFTTFDIIGHLAFAESFDCLTSSSYHPWIEIIFSTFKFVTWLRALKRLAPGFSSFVRRLIPKRIIREHESNFALSKEKLLRRKERRPEYTDFMTHLLLAEEKGQMPMESVLSNAPVLVVAGSETTATLLSGATFYLSQHPRVYKLLVEEIRSAFQGPSEITVASTGGLKYLLAVLDEALRLYPPLVNNHTRLTPAGGAMIAGRWVPPNTMVGINQYSAFRSPDNFHRSEEFVPERSLNTDDPQWARDKRQVIQPFSFGPRNCIGRNLAYVEMRLIMSRLLFEFDLELQKESGDWLNQKVFASYEKKPLFVKLCPVRRQ